MAVLFMIVSYLFTLFAYFVYFKIQYKYSGESERKIRSEFKDNILLALLFGLIPFMNIIISIGALAQAYYVYKSNKSVELLDIIFDNIVKRS